jgi:hypothetical protein
MMASGKTVQLPDGQTGQVRASWDTYYKPVIGGSLDFELVQNGRIWVDVDGAFLTLDEDSVIVI